MGTDVSLVIITHLYQELHTAWFVFQITLFYLFPAGPAGKKAGCVKPFEQLSSGKLQEEPRTRQYFDYGPKEKKRIHSLKTLLKGVQQVPSMLITNPTQNLIDINLQDYTVLDCEPLHDLKGQLDSLFTELPSLLDTPLATEITSILKADLLGRGTKRGGDYHLAALHVLSLRALVLHSPLQNDIVNLKATNTEHKERLFGQAKDLVHKATSRQPSAVILNILLRLQARQLRGDAYKSYHESVSRVSKAVSEMHSNSTNTTITHEFLIGHMSSWQAHLKPITQFLSQALVVGGGKQK